MSQARRAALRAHRRAGPRSRAHYPSSRRRRRRGRRRCAGGADARRRRRLSRPARRRPGHPGAGGAGHDSSTGDSSRLHQRLVRHDHLAIAAGGVDRGDGGLRASSSSTPPTCRQDGRRSRPRCPTRLRRVRDAPSPPPSWTRRRTSSRRASSSASRPSTASRQRLGQAQYVEGDWRRFIEGASALPGGDGGRREARRREVPGRHQPHARHAGAAGRAAASAGHWRSAAGSQAVSSRIRIALLVASVAGCASAPPKPAAPAGSIEVQYEANPPAAPAGWRRRVLGGAQRPHQGAGSAQTRRAGAAQDRSLHAAERAAGDRRPAQGPARRQLRVGRPGRWLRRDQADPGCLRLRRRHAAQGDQAAERRRHLARHRLRGRQPRRPGLERGDHGGVLGAGQGQPALPGPALGRPFAPGVPRARDGRRARPDAGRYRLAVRQPGRSGERALRQPAVRREPPRRLDPDRRRRQADRPPRAGEVLADVLQTEPRDPGCRGRRRDRQAARPDREGVPRVGQGQRACAAELENSAAGRHAHVAGRQARPDASDDRDGARRHSPRRPALVRGDADQLRPRRL